MPSISHLLMRRRQLLRSAAAAAVVASPLGAAWAQARAWPSRPVRFVVAFPPGGLADVMMRVIQPALSQALGTPVVIDNRGGAGGNVAAMEMLRARDEHSFLVTVSTTESVNPSMFANMPFDPVKQLQHVALLANSQLFLVTRPTLAPNDLKSFVAYAKANPGKLSYGSAGTGTTPHLAGELFKQSAGIFATHIPYRGAAPAIQDVMAGQIDFSFVPGTAFPMVRGGKLKLLAVASKQRTPNFPSAPTFDENGIADVHADTLFGVYAPTGTPPEVVALLNREINRQLAEPAVRARFSELGADATPITPTQFKELVQAETALFSRIVKARGIRAE